MVDFDNNDDEKKVQNKLSFMLYFCCFQETIQLKFGQKYLTDYAQGQLKSPFGKRPFANGAFANGGF